MDFSEIKVDAMYIIDLETNDRRAQLGVWRLCESFHSFRKID